MPELASAAVSADELLRLLLETADVTRLPDGRAVLAFVTDDAFLDFLAGFNAASEDLEPEEDTEEGDAEDDDPEEDAGDVGDDDHRHAPMLAADNVTWLMPPAYGSARAGRQRSTGAEG